MKLLCVIVILTLAISVLLKPLIASQAQTNAEQLLALHNQVRISGVQCGQRLFKPTHPLRLNQKLMRAAAKHSANMEKHQTLSHTLGSRFKNERTTKARLRNVQYRWSAYGENIAQGHDSATQVNELWINSPEHCYNIMDSDFTEMGAARSGRYWTVVFGKRAN